MAKRMYTLEQQDDAIATLKADHQRVRKLFQTSLSARVIRT